MKHTIASAAAAFLVTLAAQLVPAAPLGTAFTYQGRLNNGGTAANGSYDLRFVVYDAVGAGTQQGGTLTTAATGITNGLFTVTLDFGAGVFNGDSRWLEIAVRTNGGGAFIPLSPRQSLAPAPYALYALTPAGPPGPEGATGATGDTGPQGPRGLTWRGAWNVGSNYLADDALQHNGSAWLARRANTNVTPSEGADWTLLAQKGDTGSQGPQGSTGPVGATGTQGLIGLTGPQGPIGATGATGSQGAQGPQGPNTTTSNALYIGSDQGASQAGSTLMLGTDNRPVLALLESGFVGIGTNNPQATLHVAGSVMASNFVGSGAGLTTFSGGALVSGSVAGAALADNSVTSAKIPDGSVGTADLADNAVTSVKIVDLAVATADLANNAVTSDKVADASITGADLATDAAGLTKVSGGAMSSSGTSLSLAVNEYLNDKDILFRNDSFHGLGWYGGGKLFAGQNVNGPALYGNGGGVLGSVGGGTNIALQWDGSRNVTVAGTLNASGPVQFGANSFLNGKDLLLRDDLNHGLGWYGNTKPFAGATPDGPVLYGYSGGALGVLRSGVATNLALTWNSAGRVGIGMQPKDSPLSLQSGGDSMHWYNGTNYIGSMASAFGGGGIGGFVGLLNNQGGIRTWTVSISANTSSYFNGGNVGIGTVSPSQKLHVVGNIYATGTITPNSDRNLKTDFAPVDVAEVLEKVAALPIQEWRFQQEDQGVKHVGPMAQDFRVAFGLGAIPTAIATVDADGVALAAIQGLNQKVEARSQKLEAENMELKQQLAELKALVESLAGKVNGGAR